MLLKDHRSFKMGVFMKKNHVVLVLFVLILVCSLLFAVSCDKKSGNTILSIEAVNDTFVTVYTVGDDINLDGSMIRIHYSDGSSELIPVTLDMIDKSSFSTAFPANRKTLKIIYQNFVCTIPYQVKDNQSEITVKNAYLENMPSSFLKGEELPLSNGFIENALLVIELSNQNILKLPVKGIWVNDFSTSKAGNCSCTVDYESDYGPVSVRWEYVVRDLASVKEVIFEESVSIYQNQEESHLRNALVGKTFKVVYSDDSVEFVDYSKDFKISGFTSNKIGLAHCTLSFSDSKGRSIKFTLEYTVKEIFPVFQVTFDPNYDGGTIITVNTFDGKVTTPALVRNGYEILGWYLFDGESLSSEPFDFDSIITHDIILRPRWRRLTYTITIYSFGALLRAPEEYNVDTERPLDPPAPIDGYTFSHFADEQGNVFDYIHKGTFGNIILNCVWIPLGFDIVYDLNDGDSPFKATNPNPNKYDAENVLEFLPAERNGYIFEGWFYNNQLITSTEGLQKNLKLTAKWTIEEYTLSLVNPLSNEVIRTVKFKITDSNTKIADFQSDLYFFYGWFRDKDFTEEFPYDSMHQYYLPQGSFGNFSIYAKVEVKYTIILDLSNNTENKLIYFKDSDEFVDLPIPTRFGADFLAWLGTGVFNGVNFEPLQDKITADASELKKVMSENNTQSATFIASYDYHVWNIIFNLYTDYQGQDVLQLDSYATNVQKELMIPERDGYTFLGWYTNKNFTGSYYEYIQPFTFDSELTLFAKWQAIRYTITVDFFFDDIEKPFIPSSYTADDQITLPDLYYPNYEFRGWFRDAEYTIPQSRYIDKGTTGNLTLFAMWEPIRIEMRLLNMDGARYNGDLTYTLEDDIVVLSDASRPGYNFEGWFLDRNLVNKVESFNPRNYPAERAFTAYAKWSPITFSITYVLNDNATFPATNVNPTSITFEETITLLNPERVGYNFLGWFLTSNFSSNPVEVLSNTVNNLTLYAKWEVRTYNISFENCYFDGVDVSKLPSTFKASSSGTTLPTLTRKHYNFDGWFLGETKVSKVGVASDKTLCDDLVLTAKWTPKDYTLTLSASGKSGKLTYNIEDFVDGVYKLPNLVDLIPSVFDESVLKGKEFFGWYKGSNKTVLYTEINLSELANFTFTALVDYITYNVVYHLPEGAQNSSANPATFTMASKTISISAPTLENKVFFGWFLDEDFLTPAGTVSSGKTNVTTVDSDLHLFAKFVDNHQIEYILPTGVTLSSSAPKTYNVTKSVTITNPSATSFNFAGWWWMEGKKIVSTTGEFGDAGTVTLLAMVYDKSTSAKLVFTLDDRTMTASVTGYSGTSTLKIPAEVSGYKVTTIVDTAFYGNTVITSVVIPSTILSVGYRAFANCSKLATVTIEGGSISSEAFVNCPLLKTVTISPEASVADGVFANCTALTTLNVPNSKSIVSYFSKTPSSNSTVCGGYYVPNTLTTVKLVGSPSSSNGILSTCSLIKNFYIDGDDFVELSPIDVNVLKNNEAQIFVKASLLAVYQSKYEGLNFLTF